MGVSCEEMSIDLSQSQSSKTILQTVDEKLGVPSILINNAAHSAQVGYLALDAQTLDDHYAVNMRSTLLLCVEFARLLKKLILSQGESLI